MEFLPPVVAHLVADIGEFTAAMGTAKAELTGLAAANAKLAAAGKVAMAALAVGVAAVGYESVKLASGFNQTMELIHTQAGAAQSEVDGLKDAVLALAPAVGIGPEKLAEGLYHIESTGFRGKEAMDILTASAKLAALGIADLDTVTYAMSGVMSVAMKDVTSAADATNYLNTIVGMGDMKMEKLAAAIGTGILPSFKSAGLGMKDFGAALATISDNSVGADEAATRLRMTVSLMAAPSRQAVKALDSIGISETQLADDMRGPQGLLGAVMDLKTHLEESGKTASEQNAIISKAFGGGRSSSAILTLLEESDRLKSKYDQLGTAAERAKKADEAWAAQQKQFSQQMHELGAWAQMVGVKIGEWLIPKLQASATWMSKHTEVVKIFAIVIGSVLVVALAAYTVAAATAAAATIAATWPVLLIIAAVAAIAVGIYLLYKNWGTAWGFIKRISADVWHWLVDAWNATWNAIMGVVHWIKDKIIDPIVHFFDKYLVEPVKAILRVISAQWAFTWGFLGVVIDDLKERWNNTWQTIVAVFTWAWNTFIKPTMDNINTYGIQPLVKAAHWLRDEWYMIWDGIGSVVLWAVTTFVRPTMDNVNKFGITPMRSAIKWLGDEWGKIWNGIGDAIDWVWKHLIKPVVDKITGALNDVKHAVQDVLNQPGKAGAAFAHFLGFAGGGWVPGPAGAPQLAVVHGGEYVLSRDMIASAGGSTSAARMAPSGGGGQSSDGGGTTVVVQPRLYVDGKELHVALIGPAQNYKLRNGTTGLD